MQSQWFAKRIEFVDKRLILNMIKAKFFDKTHSLSEDSWIYAFLLLEYQDTSSVIRDDIIKMFREFSLKHYSSLPKDGKINLQSLTISSTSGEEVPLGDKDETLTKVRRNMLYCHLPQEAKIYEAYYKGLGESFYNNEQPNFENMKYCLFSECFT